MIDGCDTEAQAEVFELIVRERERQDAKWGWPNAGLAGTNIDRKNTILGEEVGEVARAILEGDDAGLEAELVQVAAVCVAWLESRRERDV